MDTVVARTAAEWRAWLSSHGRSEQEVWLVLFHEDSGTPGVRYGEAVEHALCYGWIDGLHRRRDAHSSRLRFTPRGPRSRWSRLNRQRAAKMIELGLMTEHGRAAIERARAAGTWQVDETVPADLREALDRDATARIHFAGFPPSSRRLILEWIATARRPATRRHRIAQTVALAAANIRAHHPHSRVSRA